MRVTHSRMLCSLPRSSGAPTWSCWQWRVVQLWPGDIFNCFVFWVKKHAAFKWKDAIYGFHVSPGSAEALVRCAGKIKIKYILIACFLGNICAKNCRNRAVYVKIIASCKGGTFFETQCIWSQGPIQNVLVEMLMGRRYRHATAALKPGAPLGVRGALPGKRLKISWKCNKRIFVLNFSGKWLTPLTCRWNQLQCILCIAASRGKDVVNVACKYCKFQQEAL